MIPQAVIFDCDGVVSDSEPIALALLAENLTRHGLPMTAARAEHLFLGTTIAMIADRARALGARLPPDWVEAFYADLYARLALGTPLMPGIGAVLDALDRAGIPYAIGSNGSDRKMQITLGQHPGLLDRFRGHVYSGQTLGCPKPDPGLFLHAARALGADPAACVVVDDSETGLRAGLAAGMRTLAFAPQGVHTDLPVEQLRDLAHLPRMLGLPKA